jgi:hypothetical protein
MEFVKKYWKFALALLVVMVFCVKCGFFRIPFKNVTVSPDQEKPFTVQPNSVTFTPKGSKEKQKISKPPEGKVEYVPATGKLTVQQFGFTAEPKLGLVWNRGDLNYFFGARLFFAGAWGLEVGGLLKRDWTRPQLAAGIDRRLPVVENITISAGLATDLTVFAPYFGAEAILLTF